MKYSIIILLLIPISAVSQKPNTAAEKSVHLVMDDWHRAVAEFDSKRYFDYMTETSRFLGTDETERWSKQEFMNFSLPYFEKKSTWDFKPSRRKVFISEDSKYAWFDEVLDTWMGPCRGSGVLRMVDGQWKIEQYNLAILVPNTKVNEYLDVIGKPRKKASDEGK